MSEAPQILTLTAGDTSVTLDTATVARALLGIECAVPWLHRDAVATLTRTLAAVCGTDHIHAVYAPQPTNPAP